nr:MAG TPA: hypothetical protein [Caudoviricetes sp.]
MTSKTLKYNCFIHHSCGNHFKAHIQSVVYRIKTVLKRFCKNRLRSDNCTSAFSNLASDSILHILNSRQHCGCVSYTRTLQFVQPVFNSSLIRIVSAVIKFIRHTMYSP